MPIRPPRLQPGDTIGIIAPASPPPDPENLDRGVAALEKLGFKMKLAPHVHKRHGFLAGSDRDRAGDLMRMFTDRKVNAILCVRGGHGTTRLLPLLDYRAIRANPKIFVGYSDITALHCAFLTQANLISFHGPMVNSDFAKADMSPFTLESFLRMLCLAPPMEGRARHSVRAAVQILLAERRARSDAPYPTSISLAATGGISHGYRRKTVQILRRGVARGQLIGGNLTLLCNLIGTPWQPPFRDRILFFEDLREEPYRFDRMLTCLLNCGLLQQVAGIAIGINRDCEDPKAKRAKEYRQTLEDVFCERLLPLKVPVVSGLPFGHVQHNATLPIGATVELDANRGDLILPRPAVV
ncbi:MAG: LD-carboxypeptidase [Verrucomicrobia bacterium]|jgi:muramoyltetrapeptide carboxypeptidase|nr:LD-carboxypeptidase [Verrucomicrobiota bacterium]